MPALSRRQALIAAAVLPLAPAFAADPAFARADRQGKSLTLFNRFALGDFEVTSLRMRISCPQTGRRISLPRSC